MVFSVSPEKFSHIQNEPPDDSINLPVQILRSFYFKSSKVLLCPSSIIHGVYRKFTIGGSY